MKAETGLNCSVGIGTSRLIAKVSSAQAKPNGVLWIVPGEEAKFLAPLDVREIPGVGKVTGEPPARARHQESRRPGHASKNLNWNDRFGKWGLALAGKARGEDAGGWFDTEVGEDVGAKSISHEHTYNEDTADVEPTRSHADAAFGNGGPPPARTADFTRAPSNSNCATRISPPSPVPTPCRRPPNSIPKSSSRSARCSARTGKKASRCACWACRPLHLTTQPDQINLLEDNRQQRWKEAMAAADRLRDKFGESSVGLATGMRGGFRERTHENPAGLPGKKKH